MSTIHGQLCKPYALPFILVTLLLPTQHHKQPLPHQPSATLITDTHDNFHGIPLATCLPFLLPSPPTPFPRRLKAPCTTKNDPIGMVKYLQGVKIAEERPDPLHPPPSPTPPPPSMTDERKPEPLPPPPPLLCARVGCGELEKRCSKCLVACYCSVECQRQD